MKTKLHSWGTKLSTTDILIYLSDVCENLSIRGYKASKSSPAISTFAVFYMKVMLNSFFASGGRNMYVQFEKER
jgi:hypothetical protein